MPDAGPGTEVVAVHVLIDAMNVLGSRPDGWWRDRDAALRRLAAEVAPWAATVEAEVVLVADGRPVPDLPAGRHGDLEVVYAERTGPDAADDRIVAWVAALLPETDRADGAEPVASHVEVITADRELRDRVVARGASVTGPRTFLERIAGRSPGR